MAKNAAAGMRFDAEPGLRTGFDDVIPKPDFRILLFSNNFGVLWGRTGWELLSCNDTGLSTGLIP